VDVRALQQHVRATGREVRATRISCWAVLMAIPCLITLVGLVLSPLGAFGPALLFLGGALLATGCVALPIAAAIRRLNRATLRRRLQTLAPPEREAVLLPLQQDQLGDTRKIVAPLIRELRAGLPGEVIPAEPADGRGNEPTSDY
jgi:hypothetical protein